MFGHRTADQWQHVSKIEQVKRPGRPGCGRGEFENNEAASGLEYPRYFGEARTDIGQVSDAEANGATVETLVGEREAECVAANRVDKIRFVLIHEPSTCWLLSRYRIAPRTAGSSGDGSVYSNASPTNAVTMGSLDQPKYLPHPPSGRWYWRNILVC